MDFPALRLTAPPVLTPFHPDSLGLALPSSGQNSLSAAGSNAWPVANKAVFYPFVLYDHAVAYQLLFWVGATSAGNVDVGIYDSQKNLIVSSGSTAMSATVNTVQELNITDTPLWPGKYLLAAACSSASGTAFRTNLSDELALSALVHYEQTTAFALPDPCTPVISTDAAPPLWAIGIQFRASIF